LLPLPELDHLFVVLVATRNPLNVGAAARAMSNFGFTHLRVVNPYEVAFREARSAVGASAVIASAVEFKTLSDAVADCSLVIGTTAVGPRELQHTVHRLENGARMIRNRLPTTRTALLFGSEKVGLSNEDLSHCDFLIRIPTRQEHRSMNLAQAVAICLYELVRQPNTAAAPVKKIPANKGDLERLATSLVDALLLSGYVKAASAPITQRKVRRLLQRLELSPDDSPVWLGIFNQIIWKLRAAKEGLPGRRRVEPGRSDSKE
jgi:TrmH family RNA methyltransferase